MSSITYHAVSAVDFDAFTAAFNCAYRDYYVPTIMSPDSFRAIMERDDLPLASAVAALDGPRVVGTGLLGVRLPVGWIGGMGVIPEYRRQGIGRQMMGYLLQQAQAQGITTVKLEVIEANEGAHQLYREMGFRDTRMLNYFTREPAPLPDSLNPTPYTVERREPGTLLQFFDVFHDVKNCWQREKPSLTGLIDHLQGWAALHNGQIVGYVLGWSHVHEIRITDIATSPTTERAVVAQALLTHLHRLRPEAYGISVNIADDDPGLPAYTALEYTTQLRQFEMVTQLPASPASS